MALQLADKKITVNALAPGPIWTPLIVSSFDKEHVKKFGKESPLGRAGQPAECRPLFVFIASEDSSYFTGQCLYPYGGYVY
jgi:NAD(P)-dependent dehydrogenase (short-subunit alcohol dehydrogenase family)